MTQDWFHAAPSACRVAHSSKRRCTGKKGRSRCSGKANWLANQRPGELVVQDNRVAAVLRPANRRSLGRACSPRRARTRSCLCLSEHSEGEFDPLHVVVGPNVAARIRPGRPVDVFPRPSKFCIQFRHAPARAALDRSVSAARRSKCQGFVLFCPSAHLLDPARLNVTKRPDHVRPRDAGGRALGRNDSALDLPCQSLGRCRADSLEVHPSERSTDSPNLESRRPR